MNITNAIYSNLHRSYLTVFPQGAVVTPRAHGIDLSKYDIFFEPSTATGQLDFVIQRASYRTTRDEAFETLVDGVMEVLIRGAYHYLNSDTDWQAQADKFLNVVMGYDYHFYACDFEGAFNVLSTDYALQAWKWIHYVQGVTHKPVLLYTSPSLYKSWIIPSAAKYGIDWDAVKLWTAQWYFTPNPNENPTVPAGRTGGWTFWQYTDQGNGPLYGVARPTACDLDVFNGTPQQLHDWLQVGGSTPPTTGETMRVIQGTAIGNVTRRQSPAGEPFTPARYLMVNDRIEASENNFQWLHLTKINDLPVVGEEWVSAGATQQYIKWSWVDVPDEPPPPPVTVTPAPVPYIITIGDDITYKKVTISGIAEPVAK